MRWLIEIIDIGTDKRFLADLLEKLGITLYREENKIYLISNQFESLSTGDEVWKLAERMRDVVLEVSNSFSGASIGFKLDSLYEQKDNASRSRYVFLQGTITVSSLLTGDVVPIVTSRGEISEEERARLETERLEREYQEKLNLVSYRVLTAFWDKKGRALKVHRFLQQELTPARMYHIYELIRADLGGKSKLSKLSSVDEDDWDRFTHSANHPEVFGDDSRHMVLKAEPPSKPMSLSEAQAFIARAADLWFQQKYLEYKNAQQP